MCYSDCFQDTGRYSILSLSFLTEFFSNDSVVVLLLLSPLFIVLIQSPGEPLIPLFCSPGTRACFMPIAQKAEPFPVSHFFFLLMLFLRKPWLTFLFRSALDVTFLMVQLLAVLHFCYFSRVDRIQLCRFKKIFLLLPFLQLLALVPEVPFLCIVRDYSRLSPFSYQISDT